MAQLNDIQLEIISKHKQELRKGDLSKLVKDLLSYDRQYYRGEIIAYMLEHGVDILSAMNTIPSNGISDYMNPVLTIPGNIIEIKDNAIRGNGFESLFIEDGVEIINKEAITNNHALKEIVLPNSLKFLGQAAFANNSSLKEIFIPDSITVLPKKLFYGCDNVVVKANYREDKANRLKCVESEIPWYKEHLKWVRND